MLAPWLAALTLAQATLFFLVVNVALVGYSILLWRLTRILFRDSLFEQPRRITPGDVGLTLACIVTNVAISILGWWLWQRNLLPLGAGGAVRSVFDFAILLLLMDFGMYVTHRIAHIRWIYPWLHGSHHEHVETNELSLFVLSPLEVLGFGLLMLTAIRIAQPTELGLSAYLATNLTVGTLGHAGVRLVGTAERTSPWLAWLDTSLFHTRHHTERECNYGFYTPIWDRLFGTLRK